MKALTILLLIILIVIIAVIWSCLTISSKCDDEYGYDELYDELEEYKHKGE